MWLLAHEPVESTAAKVWAAACICKGMCMRCQNSNKHGNTHQWLGGASSLALMFIQALPCGCRKLKFWPADTCNGGGTGRAQASHTRSSLWMMEALMTLPGWYTVGIMKPLPTFVHHTHQSGIADRQPVTLVQPPFRTASSCPSRPLYTCCKATHTSMIRKGDAPLPTD